MKRLLSTQTAQPERKTTVLEQQRSMGGLTKRPSTVFAQDVMGEQELQDLSAYLLRQSVALSTATQVIKVPQSHLA
jgi:hypothetical protein